MFAEEVLGTLTAGFALDDGVVAELAELAHGDVNLVAGDRLAASSLRGEPRAALAALLAAPKPSGSGSAPRLSDLQGRRRSSSRSPAAATSPGHFRWLRGGARRRPDAPAPAGLGADAAIPGRTATTAPDCRRGHLRARAGPRVVFSRRLTRPFKDIAAAAGEIAAGDWGRQVPVRGSAEATTMAVAFNEMTRSLRRSYERFHR